MTRQSVHAISHALYHRLRLVSVLWLYIDVSLMLADLTPIVKVQIAPAAYSIFRCGNTSILPPCGGGLLERAFRISAPFVIRHSDLLTGVSLLSSRMTSNCMRTNACVDSRRGRTATPAKVGWCQRRAQHSGVRASRGWRRLDRPIATRSRYASL